MASKGQKFKKYTLAQKEEVLAKYIEGYSAKYLEEIYGISRKTIETWKQKVLHPEKYLGQGQKRGRQKEKDLTKEDYKERYEILKKYQAFLKAQREKK
jgi:transposase